MQDPMLKNREKTEGWFEQQRMVIDTQQQHVWCDQLPQHHR